MAVNLSPIWGAGAQLLDNSGNVLSGGKIYTYAAGTTTPAVTYTSSNGNTANSNPIILNSAGRVPYEIWLTDGIEYKFVLKDSNDTLIGTWDNLTGINSNFINYYGQQEIQTATAGQTVFTLTEMDYQPGTGNLSVFVDGVNQYGPGAQYAYIETDSDTVTFVSGLHVGASVKFTTTKLENPGVADASQISYTYPDSNAVTQNVEAKLAQYVSVKDFGAVGDGVTDDTDAIQTALNSNQPIYFGGLENIYLVTSTVQYTGQVNLIGSGATIKSNLTIPFKFIDATGSRVSGLNFLPATVPYTLLRNTSTWVNTASDVVQSYQGYMPTTPADDDIWSGLSPTVQAQTTTNTWKWPTIWFTSSSAAGSSNVEVSNITGYTLTIAFDGYVDTVVRDCNFGAGASIGGIVFCNGVAQNYQYSGLGFTLPRGNNNKAINNIVKYATYSGIWWCGNDNFICQGNSTTYCGETGIKMTQTDGSAPNPVGVVNTNGVIDGNFSGFNYNDGIDAAATYALPFGTNYTINTVVSNNVVTTCKFAGIIGPGVKQLTVVGNSISYCGQYGLNISGSDCVISANFFNQNALHPELFPGVQIFDCFIAGNNCNSSHNYIYNPNAPSTYNYLHEGKISGDGKPDYGQEGSDYSNICSGGITRTAISANIPSAKQILVSPDGYSKENSGDAFGIFGSAANGGAVEMGSSNGAGELRLRGNPTAGGVVTFIPNDVSSNLGNRGYISYNFTNNTMAFGATTAPSVTSRMTVIDGPNNAYYPDADNTTKLGYSSHRWSVVYAGTGTINTSDANEKTDIVDLSDAEKRVALNLKTKLKRFKFKDAVEKKDDKARYHFGILAQEVKAAFHVEGLNADEYGVFCSDVWVDDKDVEHTLLGVRYDELLAFIIGAI